MEKVLAIESSAAICSVALMVNDSVREKTESGQRSHTQHMLPIVDELLLEGNVAIGELDTIAFSAGPGSFTGVRLATSIAKSLAFAGGIPVLPVSSLAALAHAAFEHDAQLVTCLVICDARMGDVYCGEYKRVENGVDVLTEDQLVKLDELESLNFTSTCIVGDALKLLEGIPAFRDTEHLEIKAGAANVISLAKSHPEDRRSALDAEAIYLRGKSGWKNKEQQKQT